MPKKPLGQFIFIKNAVTLKSTAIVSYNYHVTKRRKNFLGFGGGDARTVAEQGLGSSVATFQRDAELSRRGEVNENIELFGKTNTVPNGQIASLLNTIVISVEIFFLFTDKMKNVAKTHSRSIL